MKLQISTDYAIRILLYLHANGGHKGELQTATDVSTATDISYPFYVKIANQLKKHGLLESIQGRNGGYTLGRPAEEISIYDVFQAIEGELQIRTCFKEAHGCTRGDSNSCKLRAFLGKLQEDLIAEMSGKSIADLMGSRFEFTTDTAAHAS